MHLTASGPAGHYLDWSVIHVSVTNLVIIAVMVVLFVLALVVPFPEHTDGTDVVTGGGHRPEDPS